MTRLAKFSRRTVRALGRRISLRPPHVAKAPGRDARRLPAAPSRQPSPSDLMRLSQSEAVRRRFADAWVLIDRDTMAQDNAEAFYRYLKENCPAVNTWFVISETSPDWARLKKDGFRLINYGSDEHALLMKNARYLISSQLDTYILKPFDTADFGPNEWRFIFLQHGVTHNDLSRWINSKPISMLITSTKAEHASIVGDGSPYRYSSKEVVLTEMPRHDQLLRKAAKRRPDGSPLSLSRRHGATTL